MDKMKATLIQEVNELIVYLVAGLTSQRRIISNDTKPQKFNSTASADYTLKSFKRGGGAAKENFSVLTVLFSSSVSLGAVGHIIVGIANK